MRTPTEQTVTTILSRILKQPEDVLSRDASFGDLGLDSLGGIRLLGELEDRLDTTLDPMIVLDHPSIRELAAHLDSLTGAKTAEHGL